MLCQIEKNKIFQVKTISKDVWKAVVSSFMFLFNYFQVCHPLCKENKSIQFSPLNQWNKHTWFSHKILVFYRKRKIKNTCFRRAICCTPWSFFNQTRHVDVCRGVHMRSHTSYAKALLHSWLSLASLSGWSNEYQEFQEI